MQMGLFIFSLIHFSVFRLSAHDFNKDKIILKMLQFTFWAASHSESDHLIEGNTVWPEMLNNSTPCKYSHLHSVNQELSHTDTELHWSKTAQDLHVVCKNSLTAFLSLYTGQKTATQPETLSFNQCLWVSENIKLKRTLMPVMYWWSVLCIPCLFPSGT